MNDKSGKNCSHKDMKNMKTKKGMGKTITVKPLKVGKSKRNK